MNSGAHLSRETLARLVRRELPSTEIAEVLRHIGTCEECARLADADIDSDPLLLEADDEGPWHPELIAYADGTADAAEREIVESHLDDCELCRTDVADLRALRRRPSRPPRRAWRIAVAVAAAAAIAVIVFLLRRDHVPAPIPVKPVIVETHPQPVPQPPKPRYEHPEWERLVATAVATGTLTFPRELEMPPDVLRGAHADVASRVSPTGVVIDRTQPRFSWPERQGATYVVSIFAGTEEVTHSEPLPATQWTPPKPLPRGRTYVWQVQATSDAGREIIPAPPAPQAMFRIVSKRDHDELAEARKLHPDDHMLHAVLAARAGLRDEALEALRLAKLSPLSPGPGRGPG